MTLGLSQTSLGLMVSLGILLKSQFLSVLFRAFSGGVADFML
jgi:hypothetical protein